MLGNCYNNENSNEIKVKLLHDLFFIIKQFIFINLNEKISLVSPIWFIKKNGNQCKSFISIPQSNSLDICKRDVKSIYWENIIRGYREIGNDTLQKPLKNNNNNYKRFLQV